MFICEHPKFWREWQRDLMRRFYPHVPTSALAEALGRPAKAVHALAMAMGLKKTHEVLAYMAACAVADPAHGGRKTTFKKGLVPANKGKKRPPGWAPGRMAESQFKKGARPHTWVPIGSLRLRPKGSRCKDLILERKVNDLPGPNHVRWHPVHRLVWEAVNGPVPAGHAVVFKPGMYATEEALITIDRVELVTREELMRRNSFHTHMPRELARVVQLRGQLTRQINRRVRREQDAQQAEDAATS